jgi:hypothetical protein
MNQDEQQLHLLSIFHYVCAGILALIACFPIIHLIMGLVMVFHPQSLGPSKDQPPAFFGWLLVGFASTFILIGWTIAGMLVWAGRCLSRRVHHTFCFVAACIASFFMPFGTVLGIFTIIVLMRPSVKALFDAQPKPAVAA